MLFFCFNKLNKILSLINAPELIGCQLHLAYAFISKFIFRGARPIISFN